MERKQKSLRHLTAVIALLLCMPLTANALVIGFDGLFAASSTYTESGFTFTQSPLGSQPHFGDGVFGIDNSNLLSWHNNGANAQGVIVTLTKDDGGRFSLFDFDVVGILGTMLVNGITVSATGNQVVNLINVASVVFDVGDGITDGVAIDNLSIAEVSEPPMLLIVLISLIGLAYTRRLSLSSRCPSSSCTATRMNI